MSFVLSTALLVVVDGLLLVFFTRKIRESINVYRDADAYRWLLACCISLAVAGLLYVSFGVYMEG